MDVARRVARLQRMIGKPVDVKVTSLESLDEMPLTG